MVSKNIPTSLRGLAQSTLRRRATENSETETQYLTECQALLTGDDVVADGLISQNDFAMAYHSFCKAYSENSNCSSDEFSSLPGGLQAIFFEAVCNTMPNPGECANNLISMNGMKFGYIVSQEIIPEVQVHVAELCIEMMSPVFSKLYLQTSWV